MIIKKFETVRNVKPNVSQKNDQSQTPDKFNMITPYLFCMIVINVSSTDTNTVKVSSMLKMS